MPLELPGQMPEPVTDLATGLGVEWELAEGVRQAFEINQQ
ncbi:hypothetical protein J3R03_000174 [Actinoplanes couchii]|nr:hypothetical protein [Actinoplanes couchii]